MRSSLGLAWFATACGLSSVPAAQAAAVGQRYTQETQLIERRQTTTTTTVNDTFNPLAANNLATYYGRAQNSASLDLHAICNTTDVNIVVLGFVSQFNGLNQVPTTNFGSACSNYGKKTTTLSCAVLAQNISYCQSLGVKVLVSVGGASSNVTLNSSSQATQAAQTLWDIFGAGTGATSLRPFGNVTVDGFDFGKSSFHSTPHISVSCSL